MHFRYFTCTRDRVRRRGMALFVTLVIVLILYVVIYQLWHSASLEVKIAKNQGGYMKSALAVTSLIPYVLSLIQEDLAKAADSSSTEGLTSLAGADGASAASPSGAARAGSSSSGARSGTAELGDTSAAASAKGGLYDYVNKALFQPRTQSVNDVQVKIQITDTERMLNLNKLFGYVALWRREKETIGVLGDKAAASEGAGSDAVAAAATAEAGKKSSTSTTGAGATKEGADLLRGILGEDASLVEDELAQMAEEWVEPDEEQVEAAVRMVADLVIHMVESNIQNGLAYDQEYNADTTGRNIVGYVLMRKRDELQSYIYSVTELLQVEGVTHELFHGPLPPELADPGLMPEEGQEGYRRDEYGDLVYDFGMSPEETQTPMMEELRQYMDVPEVRQQNNLGRGFMPGSTALAGTPLPDNAEGDGITRPPRPIGLKHVFCTFSNGKVNLNTAPLEVILAVLQGGGDQAAWDSAMKLKIGQAIVARRDQYTDEYLQELEDKANGTTPETETEALDPLQNFQSMVATEDLKTNYFTNLADLEKIEVDGEQILKAGIDSGESDRSPATLLKKDLGAAAAFASEYFDVRLVAKGEGFRQEADIVIHRDLTKKALSVIYYRERQD